MISIREKPSQSHVCDVIECLNGFTSALRRRRHRRVRRLKAQAKIQLDDNDFETGGNEDEDDFFSAESCEEETDSDWLGISDDSSIYSDSDSE
jgi:hypothetical protein